MDPNFILMITGTLKKHYPKWKRSKKERFATQIIEFIEEESYISSVKTFAGLFSLSKTGKIIINCLDKYEYCIN